MFLSVGKAPVKDRRLYCMRITTPEEVYYKFGVASGHSSKERMLQIAASYYDKFRETPIIKVMRDRKVDADVVFKYETTLHQFFSFYQYDAARFFPFSGSTECFTIDEDVAIQAYEATLNNEVPPNQYFKPEDIIPF